MTLELRSLLQSYLGPESGPFFELLCVLGVGTAVIGALAALAGRAVRSAIWQRTIWQASTLGLLTLMFVELTGTGPALVRLWHAQTGMPTARPGAASATAPQRPSADASTDFAWPEDVDFAEGEASDPYLFAKADRVAPENQVEEAPEEVAEEAAGLVGKGAPGSLSDVEKGAAFGLPVRASIGPRGEIPAGKPPATPACWWLALIWALGAVLITGRMLCARALFFALRRRNAPVGDPTLADCVGVLARRLGMRRRVRLVEAVGLTAPVAFGSLRPTIALPGRFAEEYDRQRQEAILAHEMAHLAACDPAWQVLAGLVCAVLWWHPLVWWLRHRLRAASEAVADEASLLVPDGPDLLADCLVVLGRRLVGPRHLGWLSFGGLGFRSSLGRRVERLLNLRAGSWRAPGRGRLAFARTISPAALVMVAISCTAWARPQANLAEGGTTMNVLTTSWRRSLAATVVLTLTGMVGGDAAADDPPLEEAVQDEVADDYSDVESRLTPAEDDRGEQREDEERERQEGERREREGRGREEAEAPDQQQRLRDHEEDLRRQIQEQVLLLQSQDRALREKAERERAPERGARGSSSCASCHEGAIREPQKMDQQICDYLLERRAIDRLSDRLREAGKGEAAENLQRALGYLSEGRPELHQEQLQRHLEQLTRETDRLREAGRQEESKALKKALDFLAQVQNERPGGRPPAPPRPEEAAGLERRIGHLNAAIENLHAAGLHQHADNLRPELDRLLAERQEQFKPRPDEARRPPAHPEGPPPPEMDRAINELRSQMDELRREMDEIRRLLRGLRTPDLDR